MVRELTPRTCLRVVAVEFLDEVIHQEGNVLLALAKRRQEERDHLQAVVQVLSELPARHHLPQSLLVAAMIRTSTLMGCLPPTLRNSRHWITRRSLACKGKRKFRHLVQEEGPAVRELEHALPIAHRRGEAPLDVAEHLAFHQAFGDGGAIQNDQRVIGRARPE